MCALDDDGPLAAVVVNQATGTRFEATRGGGARADGRLIHTGGCTSVGSALVALNGYPSRHLGWKQYRSLGAAALDLCAVASGALDAYVDCVGHSLGPWDYLGGLLICQEAGAVVVDAYAEELVARQHSARRTPVAASTPELLAGLLTARQTLSG